jgi:hypothetical protein
VSSVKLVVCSRQSHGQNTTEKTAKMSKWERGTSDTKKDNELNEVRKQDRLGLSATTKAINLKMYIPTWTFPLCLQGVNKKFPGPVQDKVTSVFTLLKWNSIFIASLMIHSA